MAHHITKSAITAALTFATSPAFAAASSTSTKDEALLMLLMVVILGGLYLLPAIIGGVRHVRYGLGLYFLNLLTGWTVIGWLVCFAWSLTALSTRQPSKPILIRDGEHWRVHHIAAARAHTMSGTIKILPRIHGA